MREIELLDNLVRIRKNTGLNQEKFYEKHLKELNISDIKAKSSCQGFMKDLENGRKPITPKILCKYAQIANCSVDDLLGLSKEDILSKASPKYITFSDFASDLFSIYENEDCQIKKISTDSSSSSETYCITFTNKRIIELLKQIYSIETLNDKSIFEQWKSGVLKDSSKYKKENDYRDINEELPELLSKLAEKMKQS